jgi:hypothetical protein
MITGVLLVSGFRHSPAPAGFAIEVAEHSVEGTMIQVLINDQHLIDTQNRLFYVQIVRKKYPGNIRVSMRM